MYKNELVVEVPGGRKWRVRLGDTLYKQVLRACQIHGFEIEGRIRKAPSTKPPAEPAKVVEKPAGKDNWNLSRTNQRGGGAIIRASYGRLWGRSEHTGALAKALADLGVEPREARYKGRLDGVGIYWQDATNEQLVVAWQKVFRAAQ